MVLQQLNSKSDFVGAFASGLCLVHCVAAPFLFVAHAGVAAYGDAHPLWWGFLDMVFLGISLAAVWWSARTTSKKWMRNALWISWSLLAIIVFNEKLSLFPLMEQAIYAPTIALIFLHIQNRKYCTCADAQCCGNEK